MWINEFKSPIPVFAMMTQYRSGEDDKPELIRIFCHFPRKI